MYKNNFYIEILTNNDNPMTEYSGKGKTYVEARKNSTFKIKISNPTQNKILAVPTVDGVSVIDGQEGKYSSPGYVIEPDQHVIIDGWRVNNNNVRKFQFSKQKGSYSNKRGLGVYNNGIIGVAIFNEVVYRNPFKYSWNPTFSSPLRGTPDVFLGAVSSASASLSNSNERGSTMNSTMDSFGTKMGREQNSRATKTIFNREKRPTSILELHYLSRRDLESLGIIKRKKNRINNAESFPKERNNSVGYCPVA